MSKIISVMLVEDNKTYRRVIARAFASSMDLELTSEFGTAEIALRSLQNPGKKPDLVLLDLNLPGMNGLDALPWFRDYAPDSKILILTQSDTKADILAAIAGGTAGYLLKSSTAQQIRDAIRSTMAGGTALDPSVANQVITTLRKTIDTPHPDVSLPERQMEILVLLCDGKEKKEISKTLNISQNTVAYHVKKLYENLGVTNAPAAISKGYRLGLLQAKP